MRRAVWFMLAAGLAMATAAVAHAESPERIIQHILFGPGGAFRGPHHAPRHRAPAPAPVPAPLASETPLVEVPMPHLRPVMASAVPTLAYQAEPPPIIAAPIDAIPMPRVSPVDTAPVAAAPETAAPETVAPVAVAPEAVAPVAVPLPRPAPQQLASLPPFPDLIRPPPAAQSTCGLALAELGVEARPLAAIEDGQCGIPDPVALASLAGGKVSIAGAPVVDCAVAETLARWMDGTVQPMAASIAGGKVTGLRVLDAYSCRNRDGLADAKLSEHAHGNAIDIGAFQIDGDRWLTVGDATVADKDAEFLAAVRKSACGPFTTVLGPGSDSYHANHFHLDLAQRRTAGPSRGLFCE